MAAPQITDCPWGSATPGRTIILHGTADDCEGIERTVKANNANVPFTWACEDGHFTIKFDMPPCVQGGTNVVTVLVMRGGVSDTCQIAIDC